MRLLAIAALVACGGKSAPPVIDKPVEPPVVEAPCAPAGVVPLAADGTLACRELPFAVQFPAGTELTRQNDRALTLYTAKLERGAMLLIAEPRTDAPDAARITGLLEMLARAVTPDAVSTPIDAPKLPGTTAAAAIKFTTPDGGEGIVHGFVANHWLVALSVGASIPESPARPDKPGAQAFLASIKVKPLPTGTTRYALADGAHLDLPASSWSTGTQPPSDGVRSEVIHVAPDRGIWIGVRELEMRDRCTYLKGAVEGPQDDIAERLKTIYSNTQHPLSKIERAKLGDLAVYAEADSPTTHVVMYLVCDGKTVVQLTVAGEKPTAELRPHLDEVAKSLVGAR